MHDHRQLRLTMAVDQVARDTLRRDQLEAKLAALRASMASEKDMDHLLELSRQHTRTTWILESEDARLRGMREILMTLVGGPIDELLQGPIQRLTESTLTTAGMSLA